jgi:hypothetical protein
MLINSCLFASELISELNKTIISELKELMNSELKKIMISEPEY